MSRFDEYHRLRQRAEDETKIGGDPMKAIALALLALAAVQVATEP